MFKGMWLLKILFEICTSAFEDVPITSVQFNMTDDMYWIDDYAFYGTNLTGELVLPDGLVPIGQVARRDQIFQKLFFQKLMEMIQIILHVYGQILLVGMKV